MTNLHSAYEPVTFAISVCTDTYVGLDKLTSECINSKLQAFHLNSIIQRQRRQSHAYKVYLEGNGTTYGIGREKVKNLYFNNLRHHFPKVVKE